ncbi:hypothetical protein COCVIDRAFT_14804 [Bipolaris victoriae FI3]|uniref:Hydrophobin n=1 Tax=Bipolaris victoriae (strain FI3) TaxID=930091 RepID=W7EDM7_BIPV3|nr:hypothetical protein COCVIDRAFT_14804 [Bipolaris victoriae FI3]
MQFLTLLSLGLSATFVLAAPTADLTGAALTKRQAICGDGNRGSPLCFGGILYTCTTVVMGDANVIDRVSLAVGVRLWNVMRQERDVIPNYVTTHFLHPARTLKRNPSHFN